MLRKIKFKEFKNLYRKHIIRDFPSNERPRLKSFRRRMIKLKEQAYIFQEDGTDKGYCIIDILEKQILVSFLAVYAENRGKGIGTKILKELQEKYSNKKAILLEVEDPDFSENEVERNIREKRIKFYEKSGFKIVKDVKLNLFMTNYKIMIYGEESNNSEEIKESLKQFYTKCLDKKRWKYIEFKD